MFLILAAVGFVLLLFALVFDDILDGLLDGVLPETDWLSLPSLAAFTTAFGAAGFILEQSGQPVGVALGGGGLAALFSAVAAVRFSRTAMAIPTDSTPTSGDLVGSAGRVVTPIAAGSSGEVLVPLAGQPVKLLAHSLGSATLPTGTHVIVVSVQSSTRVTVQEAEAFWGTSINERKE